MDTAHLHETLLAPDPPHPVQVVADGALHPQIAGGQGLSPRLGRCQCVAEHYGKLLTSMDVWQLVEAVSLRPEAFAGMAFHHERGVTLEVDSAMVDLMGDVNPALLRWRGIGGAVWGDWKSRLVWHNTLSPKLGTIYCPAHSAGGWANPRKAAPKSSVVAGLTSVLPRLTTVL
jgi:hypothetical protein